MQVTIVGGGPAGLYAAILIKRKRPDARIQVFEQNPASVTWGFGVVFSDQAMEFLRADDGDTADLIAPYMMHWSDIAVVHKGERVTIDGVGFAGIGRLELLDLLCRRAAGLDIEIHHATEIMDIDAIEADLIIGADGLNSTVRGSADFGARLTYGSNRFVWYGASRTFDALTQTFVETRFGPMTAHHYSYAAGHATFIIEMPELVFDRAGFAVLDEPAGRNVCADIFSATLEGAELTANNSQWRRFPDLECQHWHLGNRVLVGDALHTAHFSIGSGTRLAMEDVIALVKALEGHDWDLAKSLPAYQAARAPVLVKLVEAARASRHWYEGMADRIGLDPWSFALSYIRRAGRLDANRLRDQSPLFVRQLEARNIDPDMAN